MAIADGFIGTNNGMGQGLAYVLPQSKSEDYALKMAQDESRQLAATAAAKLKRQQLLQDNIGKQFAAQKLPALWSPYNAAVSDAAKQWQTKAATYNATAGQSPFTNPELMNDYNTNVLGLAQKSKELGDKYTKLYSTAVADGGNKYTPESVKSVLDFEETVKKDPMAALNMPLPELKPASATFDDFNKLIKPTAVTNDNGTLSTTKAARGNHITQGLETVISNPDKWNPMTEKQFGLNLYLPTFPIKNAQGRNIYPTNERALDKFADNILSQQDAPAKLADFGITPEDEFKKEKLVDAMRKQNAGMGKFLTSVADLADAKVDKKSNYDNWRERSNYNSRQGAGATASGTPEDLVIPFADGKGVAEGKGYVKVPMATKNFAGTKGAIDLSTGKPVDLSTSSNDYQVVGVANFPFINKDVRDNAGNTIPKGSLAQPRFAQGNSGVVSDKPMIHVQLKEGDLVSDYLVPFDRMPENLTKNDKAILSSFKPSSGQTAPKQQTIPKAVQTKFKGVPKTGF